MAETTTNDIDMTRAEAAAFLRSIADQLDSGRGAVSIPVGNKEIRLSPPDSIGSKVTVTERSRRLRRDTEELTLQFKWNPTGDVTASGTGGETEPVPESGPRSESDGGSDRGRDR